MEELRVTSIDQLLQMSSGELVELPPFVRGQKFIARLRRPSLMKLVEKGKIPNSLLRAANTIFAGEVNKELDTDDTFMSDIMGLVDVFAESVFVEPTWEEIKHAGIELTDEQYMFIFNYTQQGVSALDSFREESADISNNKPEQNVPMQTLSYIEHN